MLPARQGDERVFHASTFFIVIVILARFLDGVYDAPSLFQA